MRASELGLVLLIGVIGCGLDAGDGKAGSRPPPPVQPGPECVALNAKAVSCALALPGTNLPCDEPEDQRDECEFDCFVQAQCSELRALACEQGPEVGPVFDCIDGCRDQPFRCDSGDLVSSGADCDGFFDCADGSDEQRCNGDVFVCAGGVEIGEFGVCDGFPECPQGDDELDCFFECDGGLTLFRDSRCDGLEDCADGTDELGCPVEVEPICN